MRVADDLTLHDLKVEPPQGLSYDELARWKYQRPGRPNVEVPLAVVLAR